LQQDIEGLLWGFDMAHQISAPGKTIIKVSLRVGAQQVDIDPKGSI
jgi:hypothetical protein